MKKEEKDIIIEGLTKTIQEYKYLYLADISTLNADQTSKLRRKCFEKNIKLILVKNTLLKKALEKTNTDYSELFSALKGNTSVMLCDTGNVPAKLIKEFRAKSEKPVLKGAYIEECFYLGDNQLNNLVNLKSKDELIGDIVGLLQSPMKNVMSSLQSGSNKITGILKTLADKK